MNAPAPEARPSGLRGLAMFACIGAASAVYMTRSADADLWGHLYYGRFYVEQGGLPTADPFAFTSAGQQWSSHEYLSQVLLWLAYATGGTVGLVLLKCAVGGGAVALVYSTIRLATSDVRIWAPVLLLTSHVVGRWFLFRPQLFTFVLFAFFLRVLFAHLLGKPARLWLLPLALVFWVNLHGGFLAGIGLVGLALGLRALQSFHEAGWRVTSWSRATRPLALTLGACVVVSLLNPLGWRIWPYLVTELTCEVNRQYIQEWQPLSLAEHGWTALTFWLVLLMLAMAALGAGGRRVSGLYPTEWLLSCVPLAVMATRSVRHVPICALWVGPVLALLAQASWQRRESRKAWKWAWGGAGALTVVPAFLTLRLVLAAPHPTVFVGEGSLGSRSPAGAVAFLRDQGLAGRVYNPLWWGSYLTWELFPAIRVSMDGRNVTLFSPALVAENLAFFLGEDPPTGAPDASGADYLLVPTDTPVLPRLRTNARWQLLFDDGQAVLFVRASAVTP